jgi:hypothetical protein
MAAKYEGQGIVKRMRDSRDLERRWLQGGEGDFQMRVSEKEAQIRTLSTALKWLHFKQSPSEQRVC